MAIQNEPTRISTPFADSGTKNVIPETMAQPSATAAASWQAGFPTVCSLPLSAGGIPPARNDFNGLFNQLSQTARYLQDGGVYRWSEDVDYGTWRLARGADTLLYYSIAQSGPNTSAGPQDPMLDTSHTYWVAPKVPTMPLEDNSRSAASTEWVRTLGSSETLPADLYVDPVNGSDSNSGESAAEAKKTVSAVLAKITSYSKKSAGATTVHLAPGTYTSNLTGVSGVSIDYVCASGAIINGGFFNTSSITTIAGTVTFTAALTVARNAVVDFQDATTVTFSGVSESVTIHARQGGLITKGSSATVSFVLTDVTASDCVVKAADGGMIAFFGSSPTWSGTNVTGKSYRAARCGLISGIGSPTAIPGTTGSVDDTSSAFQ